MLSTLPTSIVSKPGAEIARLAGYENLMGKGLCEVRFGRPLISEGCERVPRAREIKAGFLSFHRRRDGGRSFQLGSLHKRESAEPAQRRARRRFLSGQPVHKTIGLARGRPFELPH